MFSLCLSTFYLLIERRISYYTRIAGKSARKAKQTQRLRSYFIQVAISFECKSQGASAVNSSDSNSTLSREISYDSLRSKYLICIRVTDLYQTNLIILYTVLVVFLTTCLWSLRLVWTLSIIWTISVFSC